MYLPIKLSKTLCYFLYHANGRYRGGRSTKVGMCLGHKLILIGLWLILKVGT